MLIFSVDNFSCIWLINPDFHSQPIPSEDPPNKLQGEEPQEDSPSFPEATTFFFFILNLNIESCAKILPKKQFTSLNFMQL